MAAKAFLSTFGFVKPTLGATRMTTRYLRTAVSAAAIALTAASGAAIAAAGEPTVAEPTNANVVPGAKDNFDPTYNVCRGTDPRCYHPWVAERQNKVLLY